MEEEVKQLTKIVLAWELFEKNVPKSHIAKQLGVHRETIHLWIVGILNNPEGLSGFLKAYEMAKKGERMKRKTDGLLKTRIYRLREENRRCCGIKIKKYLKDEYDITLGITTIYKILGEKYKLRSKWKKNQKRGPVPKAFKPREVVQVDSVDFGEVFAFTGVDIFVKDVAVKLYPTLTSSDGKDFLDDSFKNKFHHTNLLQADGGPEFKGEFKQNVFTYADRFRVARPYKKNEQSYIESFNRTLRKECLGWGKYKPQDIPAMEKDLKEYLFYYHTKRAHLSLDLKTPNDILEEYQVTDF